jgi:hypothetical protein
VTSNFPEACMANEDDVFDVIVIGAGKVGETAAARRTRRHRAGEERGGWRRCLS